MPKATHGVKRAARRLVQLRDGMSCRRCGKSILGRLSSVHHRLNKGNGGSALLERASVLVRVCGTGTTDCHGWIGANPEEAGQEGWLLPRNNPDIDPENEPLLTFDGWVLIDDAGEIKPCDAPRQAA